MSTGLAVLLPLKWLLQRSATTQSVAAFNETLICQNGDKVAIKCSQSAISL